MNEYLVQLETRYLYKKTDDEWDSEIKKGWTNEIKIVVKAKDAEEAIEKAKPKAIEITKKKHNSRSEYKDNSFDFILEDIKKL